MTYAMLPRDIYLWPRKHADPRLILDPATEYDEVELRDLTGIRRSALAWARRHRRVKWIGKRGSIRYLGWWIIAWIEAEEDRAEHEPVIDPAWECWVSPDDDEPAEDGLVGRFVGAAIPLEGQVRTLTDVLPLALARIFERAQSEDFYRGHADFSGSAEIETNDRPSGCLARSSENRCADWHAKTNHYAESSEIADKTQVGMSDSRLQDGAIDGRINGDGLNAKAPTEPGYSSIGALVEDTGLESASTPIPDRTHPLYAAGE